MSTVLDDEFFSWSPDSPFLPAADDLTGEVQQRHDCVQKMLDFVRGLRVPAACLGPAAFEAWCQSPQQPLRDLNKLLLGEVYALGKAVHDEGRGGFFMYFVRPMDNMLLCLRVSITYSPEEYEALIAHGFLSLKHLFLLAMIKGREARCRAVEILVAEHLTVDELAARLGYKPKLGQSLPARDERTPQAAQPREKLPDQDSRQQVVAAIQTLATRILAWDSSQRCECFLVGWAFAAGDVLGVLHKSLVELEPA